MRLVPLRQNNLGIEYSAGLPRASVMEEVQFPRIHAACACGAASLHCRESLASQAFLRIRRTCRQGRTKPPGAAAPKSWSTSWKCRPLQDGIFLFPEMHLNMSICIFSLCAGSGQYRGTAFLYSYRKASIFESHMDNACLHIEAILTSIFKGPLF